MKLANLEKVRGGGADDQPKSIWHGSEFVCRGLRARSRVQGQDEGQQFDFRIKISLVGCLHAWGVGLAATPSDSFRCGMLRASLQGLTIRNHL